MMMLPGQLLESTDVVRQGESVYTMITALGAVLLHRLLSSVSAALTRKLVQTVPTKSSLLVWLNAFPSSSVVRECYSFYVVVTLLH